MEAQPEVKMTRFDINNNCPIVLGITLPKQDAEFLQAANAFSKVRSAQHFLHLQLSSVHLIKFFG